MLKKWAVLILFLLGLIGCIQKDDGSGGGNGDDTSDDITQTELLDSDLAIPGAASMKVDLSDLSSIYFSKSLGEKSNFNQAAVLTGVVTTVAGAIISPYAAVLSILAYKIVYEPTTITNMTGSYKNAKLVKVVIEITDSTTFGSTTVSYNAKFTGEDLDSNNSSASISWTLELECLSPSSACSYFPDGYFTYFTGETPKTKDENGYEIGEGFWKLYGPWDFTKVDTLFTKEIFRIDYNIADNSTENLEAYLTITNTDALEGKDDVLKYCLAKPSLTIDYSDADTGDADSNDYDAVINFNATTQNGSLKSAIYTENLQACWDESHVNATCTGDITSVCQ